MIDDPIANERTFEIVLKHGKRHRFAAPQPKPEKPVKIAKELIMKPPYQPMLCVHGLRKWGRKSCSECRYRYQHERYLERLKVHRGGV